MSLPPVLERSSFSSAPKRQAGQRSRASCRECRTQLPQSGQAHLAHRVVAGSRHHLQRRCGVFGAALGLSIVVRGGAASTWPAITATAPPTGVQEHVRHPTGHDHHPIEPPGADTLLAFSGGQRSAFRPSTLAASELRAHLGHELVQDLLEEEGVDAAQGRGGGAVCTGQVAGLSVHSTVK